MKFLFIILQIVHVDAMALPDSDYKRYCDQLQGVVTESSEVSKLDELQGLECRNFECKTSKDLSIMMGVPGENVSFQRQDDEIVYFEICKQDKKKFGPKDLKVHFSYANFDKSGGKFTSMALVKGEPCYDVCKPQDKDSYDYLCKHCIRAEYFSSVNDVDFFLASFVKGNECLSNYSVENCKNSRSIASANEQNDPMIVTDKIELMLCELKEGETVVHCGGIDYNLVQGTFDQIKAYFISVPYAVAPDQVFRHDIELQTKEKIYCTNTGKTPFVDGYEYVSCYNKKVYARTQDEKKRNLGSESIDDGHRGGPRLKTSEEVNLRNEKKTNEN
ncbi:MAG: hypothetical protein JNM93_14260 [Bacteriovoracaceae bacterium]|nr:hypothetical protein [Bacteriovoracaceae bacterium]